MTGYRVLKLDDNVKLAAKNTVEPISKESDAEIIERMRERFDILEDMTRAVKKGEVRAMIVSGAPGVGKSFGVEKVLAPHAMLSTIADDSKLKKFEVVKGAMSAIGLYKKLYEYSDRKCILVFDDCDSVLLDDIALNILKAALDTSKKRVISWNTDSRSLIAEGVPNSFEYKGGAIFITNINFANIKSKKLQDHLAALESRCHYIDLTIHTERDKMLRIKQIVGDGMLKEYEFSVEQEAELVEFVDANKKRLRELSLRTVLKAADLIKSFPSKWQRVAEVSLMR
jgi:hypothetical protein